MRIVFRVNNIQYAAQGSVYPAGEHEETDPEKIAAIGHADSCSETVTLVEADAEAAALIADSIEDDEVSLERQAAAMADGSWHIGNTSNFVTTAEQLLARDADPDDELQLADHDRVWLQHGHIEATAILAKMDEGASYEDAAAAVKAGDF